MTGIVPLNESAIETVRMVLFSTPDQKYIKILEKVNLKRRRQLCTEIHPLPANLRGRNCLLLTSKIDNFKTTVANPFAISSQGQCNERASPE